MEDLYTLKQVAEKLQVTKQTLNNWRKANLLNVIKLGKRQIRITENELQRLVKKNETE